MSALPMRGAFADAQPLTYRPHQRPCGDTDQLVKQHLPLVRRIAWHVHGSMSSVVEVEDLIQVGLVALVEAAANFDARGMPFKTYLITRLRGSMIDELRRQATTTRGAMRRRRRYADAIATLTARTGTAPGEDMVAQHIGVSIEKLRAD